jgi:hypothetical protein
MVLLAGRSREWQVGHLLHFAPPRTWRPRSRRRGKGAKGGRASGFPCGAAGSRGSGTPLPFLPSSSCCPGFFCERREASSAKGGPRAEPGESGLGKSAPRTRSDPDPGARLRGERLTLAFALSWRWAPPVVWLKANFVEADLSGPGRARFHRNTRSWTSIGSSRASAKPSRSRISGGLVRQVRSACGQSCSFRGRGPSRCRHRLAGLGAGKLSRTVFKALWIDPSRPSLLLHCSLRTYREQHLCARNPTDCADVLRFSR